MTNIRLNEMDEEILNRLQDGRNVPANLAEELDVSRQYIYRRLKRMREHGIVRNIGRGVYELADESAVQS